MLEIRRQTNQPLQIAEIGTGSGQMKSFADYLFSQVSSSDFPKTEIYSRWDAFDIAPLHEKLTQKKYNSIHNFDANSDINIDFSEYTVFLLLHVLEHLHNPEQFCSQLAKEMRRDCAILIGVPSLPNFLAQIRERQLQRKYLVGGHWCKFSPNRLRALAKGVGWEIVDMTGAFLLRASGSILEDSKGWMAFNLMAARILPSWPGEVYLCAKANFGRH